MDELIAEHIVTLIRSQNWKNGGVLSVDRDEAIKIVAQALESAYSTGQADAMQGVWVAASPEARELIVGKRSVGGTVVLPIDDIDTAKTYNFEAKDSDGITYRWVGKKPCIDAANKVAIFTLAGPYEESL